MNIKSIVEKLREKDKNKIRNIIIIMIVINLLMACLKMFTTFFSEREIIKTIFNSLIGIVNIILVLLIIKSKEKLIEENKIKLKKKYSPILLKFFYNSKVDVELNTVLAECLDLKQRNLLQINRENEDCIFSLKNENFLRMNGIEAVEDSKIDDYSTNDILPYENLYVTKILFPFENTISFKEMIKKSNEGYYKSRLEMCELLLEKMIIHELEKNNEVTGDKSKIFLILLLLNIIIAIFTLFTLGVFNILLLLGTISNLLISGILIKNEDAFGYNFIPEISDYIDCIAKYAKQVNLENEDLDREDLIIKILFDDLEISNEFMKLL